MAKVMVTSPHPLASEVGRDVLLRGGTAAEAAVACGAVLAVVQPHFCGLGGDAVMMLADRQGRRNCLLGIGHAVAAADSIETLPTRGPGSAITTACVVDCWAAALAWSETNWGSARPIGDLLEPAIRHARNGFPMSASQRFWHDFRRSELASWPGFQAVFGSGEGTVRQPALAATLEAVARNGPRDFYEGELAARIAGGLAQAGAPITLADLAATRTRAVAPLDLPFGDMVLAAPPRPTQGETTLTIMGLLQRLGIAEKPPGSADFVHACVEAVKVAFLERQRIGDSDAPWASDPADWSEAAFAARAEMVDMSRARPWPATFAEGDTVFFGAVDSEGRCASVLQSIYFDWGSGVMAGDTGILWHNRGAAFSLDAASPNRLAAGRRPFFTLNPGIAFRDGRPALTYGTQGADGQPQTLAVILSGLIAHGLSPEQALAQPRFLLGRTFSDANDTLKLEGGRPSKVRDDLIARGHEIADLPAMSPLVGQAGVIAVGDDGSLSGAHDPRGEGVALN